MHKYITLIISCLAFFMPALARTESSQKWVSTNNVQNHSKRLQAEKELFLKLKKSMDPKKFDGGTDCKGMMHKS